MYAAQLYTSEPEPEPRCRYLIHACFTPKCPFSPSQRLPSLLLCFLHLSSCNISFPPASSTVLSGFAASYLPTVKAVPRLLKSLLPGGREDGGAISGGSSPTAITQQVQLEWIRAHGLLTVLKGLSILFVSLWHLNIPSAQHRLIPFLLLPWKQSLCSRKQK